MFDYKKFMKEDGDKSDLMKKVERMNEVYERATQSLSNMTGNLIKDSNLIAGFSTTDDKAGNYIADGLDLFGATNEFVRTTLEYEIELTKKVESMDAKLDTLSKDIETVTKMIDSQNELIKTLKKTTKE